MGAAIQTSANTPVSTGNTLGFNTTTAILEREVGSKVFYVDSSASPFALLSSRTGGPSVTNPRYEWYEKSLRQKYMQLGAAYVTASTTITVGDATVVQINDLVKNMSTGEVMRVLTIASTTTFTVTRAFGETAAGSSTGASDDLVVIGSSWKEGADAGAPDEWQESQVWNLTQIFRRPFGATGTREASNTYFGQTRPRLRAEKAVEHAIDMERAILFGERIESVSGNDVSRGTRGFLKFATSNIKDASGTLTENELEDWLADVFAKTAAGDTRTLFASAKVVSVIDQLAASRLMMVPSDKTYGIAVGQFQTSHGTLNIVKHRLLENGAGGQGYGGYALAVDPKMLALRDMSGRSTKLRADVAVPGVDGWVDEYLTETGFQLMVPQVHGVLKGVTA